MNKPTYAVQSLENLSFSFMSIGRHGIILKVIEFSEMGKNVYNLGFGDYDFTKNDVDDKIVSDNGDTEKVLATVIGILHDFLKENPYSTVFIEGSTPVRTRLYQIAINTYFEEFSKEFLIFGNNQNASQPFQKNINYESFLIKKLL